MKFLKSKRVVLPNEVKPLILAIQGTKIVGFLDYDTKLDEIIDYGNNRVMAGICDTHNHGTYGYSLDDRCNEDKVAIKQNIRHYLKALTYEGVTSGLPTVTDTIAELTEVVEEGFDGIRVLGIHSEGPYLNRVGEGGRPEPHPPVNLEFVQKMVDDSKGLLKLVAISPEIENSDKACEYLISRGVRIAYAHSDCKSKEAKNALKRGYTVSTHTANVMVGLHHRDIGGLGVMLTDPNIQCEFISDGLHVSMDFIDIMFRIKDKSKFMMVSDSVSLAGIAPGRYDTGWVTPLNVSKEGFVRDDDGRLMGSSKSVLYEWGIFVEKLHLPITEVSKLCSLNACEFYGFGHSKGSIEIGKDADLVVISDDYEALATYVEGSLIFDRKIETPIFNPNFKF